MDPEEMKAMVVKDLGLDGLPAATQDQIIDQFSENALKKVTIVLFDRLPEEGKAQFMKLGEHGDPEALLKLFQQHIPDMDAVVRATVQEEVKAFKEFQAAAQ
jgi:hypothetical protein